MGSKREAYFQQRHGYPVPEFNGDGDPVHFGEGHDLAGDTGRKGRNLLYCGQRKDECRCGGCGDVCGPLSGCPCTACVELVGFKVNAVGVLAKRKGNQGLFYCGQDMEEHTRCRCGLCFEMGLYRCSPLNNGCPCVYCDQLPDDDDHENDSCQMSGDSGSEDYYTDEEVGGPGADDWSGEEYDSEEVPEMADDSENENSESCSDNDAEEEEDSDSDDDDSQAYDSEHENASNSSGENEHGDSDAEEEEEMDNADETDDDSENVEEGGEEVDDDDDNEAEESDNEHNETEQEEDEDQDMSIEEEEDGEVEAANIDDDDSLGSYEPERDNYGTEASDSEDEAFIHGGFIPWDIPRPQPQTSNGSGNGTGSNGTGSNDAATNEPEPSPNDKETCVVCLERKRKYILVPCGHFSYCQMCVHNIHHCALCRASIQQRVIVYD